MGRKKQQIEKWNLLVFLIESSLKVLKRVIKTLKQAEIQVFDVLWRFQTYFNWQMQTARHRPDIDRLQNKSSFARKKNDEQAKKSNRRENCGL